MGPPDYELKIIEFFTSDTVQQTLVGNLGR